MSTLHPITNHEVIPEISSELFVGNEAAHLAVGIVAIGNNVLPGLENEYHGYSLLRGNVYALQKEYMSRDELNPNGTESDADDLRSVHFAVVENAVSNQRVVGAMRLIIKSKEHDAPLPIEEHYPEAFGDGTPLLSTEVSRWIGRHEVPKTQNAIKWPLFGAAVSYIMENQLGPVYGAVEEKVQRGLQISGVPVTALTDGAKFVPEFNAKKLPVLIDVASLARRMEGDRPDMMDAALHVESKFVYSGSVAPAANVEPTAV